jgi:hypothetical protein
MAAATPIPASVPGQSFSVTASETGKDTGSPSHRQLQLQLHVLMAPYFDDLVLFGSVECMLGLVCVPFSLASTSAPPFGTLKMLTRRAKASRTRTIKMTEATRASAKAVTLGNLAETMPDIVASMTSKEGILGTQEQDLCSTRGEMGVGGRED